MQKASYLREMLMYIEFSSRWWKKYKWDKLCT